MLTLEEFRQRTSSRFLGRRNHARYAYIDLLLGELACAAAIVQPRERGRQTIEILLLLIEECDNFPQRHPVSSSAPVIQDVRQQALAHARDVLTEVVQSRSLGHGKTGWARLKAVIAPVIRGARANCLVLNTDYWGEAVIEGHYPFGGRNGSVDCLEMWKFSASRANYVDWLREDYIPRIANLPGLARAARTFFHSVVYGDDDDRAQWRVTFRDGLLYDHMGELFHTGAMVSGAPRGWAIFVRTPDGLMYAHAPEVNAFHHSSFNAGAPVRAAGEIAVRHGVVAGVTNKSGHYTPSGAHFLDMLLYLRTEGVNLGQVAACPEPFAPVRIFYAADDVLNTRGAPVAGAIRPPMMEGVW